jgi:hypothetical protein
MPIAAKLDGNVTPLIEPTDPDTLATAPPANVEIAPANEDIDPVAVGNPPVAFVALA